MKDPDRGAGAPKGGAAGGGEGEGPAALPARGEVADPARDGAAPARSGRHSRRTHGRHGQSRHGQSGHGQARHGQSGHGQPPSGQGRPDGAGDDTSAAQHSKKRRKRRRGRKVFARDDARTQQAANEADGRARPNGAAAAAPADAASVVRPEGGGTRPNGAAASAQPEGGGERPNGAAASAWREGGGERQNGAAASAWREGGGERPNGAAASAWRDGGGERRASGAPAQRPLEQPAAERLSSGQRQPEPRGGPLPVYAALDLGTNNCRLLVAVPGRPGQFRVIDAFSRIVRLGEGLSASGRLGQNAMDRAVEALKVCADKLGNRQVRKARLIATEACRAAENGGEFLARVEEEAGLKLEIIDRKTEARLAVSGCGPLVERGTEGVVLFDIGGGSSEIALIDVSRHRTPRLANHIVSWTSLPVGVVSLAERFGGRHVSTAVFEAMVTEVARLLDGFEGRGRLAHLASGAGFHLLGTSGTVTTLAGVHLGLERYDRRRVDGLWMDNGHVDAMIERLLSWDFDQRVANPCIGADRADLVLAGCAILEAIRRHWPSERLRVADRGLREGMLSELMADDGVWRRNRQEGHRGTVSR